MLGAIVRAGHAQFVIASHSPILLACPGAGILDFDAAPVTAVRYEDTDHYRVYRDFLSERRAFLEADNAVHGTARPSRAGGGMKQGAAAPCPPIKSAPRAEE